MPLQLSEETIQNLLKSTNLTRADIEAICNPEDTPETTVAEVIMEELERNPSTVRRYSRHDQNSPDSQHNHSLIQALHHI